MSSHATRAGVAAVALLVTLIAAAAALAANGGSAPAPSLTAPIAPALPAGLTDAQLIGQKVIYSYGGAAPPAALIRRIRRGEVAGVIVFADNIPSRRTLRSAIRRLQAIPRPAGLRAPLLVMIDQEGGFVKRLSGAPSRSPAAIGATRSTAIARSEGRATASNLLDVGVNVNLAPVVDVGRPGSFQQRIKRSYSSDPAVVSALGSAFAAALQSRHVAATLKHFPGLGVIARDEDSQAQRVRLSLSRLRAVDERPFAAGIAAGAGLVMTSTAIYPALSNRPALLSRSVSTGELRGHLHFTGVSVTDDLTTRGLGPFGTPATLGLAATRAGNDLLLYAGGYDSAAGSADAVTGAARSGRLNRTELRASVARILALRATLSG